MYRLVWLHFKASGADYLIAIGGGSSMDTAKAIGIIIANPEFEDVRSLEGVAPTKKPCVPDHRSSNHSRYCSRGYHQLRYHRCREEA
ncbi:MAG: iron-containing alcohol dehydrogenase [Clostridium sp.]